jgi:hypothetical protein
VDAVVFGINIVALISIVSGFMKSVCHLQYKKFKRQRSPVVLDTIYEETVYAPEERQWFEQLFGCPIEWKGLLLFSW